MVIDTAKLTFSGLCYLCSHMKYSDKFFHSWSIMHNCHTLEFSQIWWSENCYFGNLNLHVSYYVWVWRSFLQFKNNLLFLVLRNVLYILCLFVCRSASHFLIHLFVEALYIERLVLCPWQILFARLSFVFRICLCSLPAKFLFIWI